jgi:DNA topoisomerase-1
MLGSGRLKHTSADELTIRRRRAGTGFAYVQANGRPLRDQRTLYRIKRLAVPPAYREVVFATDPHAHIQAKGRDSAGRTQYRYHPDWDKVREARKARRLADLLRQIPKIRSVISRHLRSATLTREFALAAVVDLVACTALRPGSETYARQHGTRGAATLLKSDVSIASDRITLRFRGKGGRAVEKEFQSRRLAGALKRMMKVPGSRLFQYHAEDGATRRIRRRDVNGFLRAILPKKVTIKDFRTLIACSCALEQLANLKPKPSARGRKIQILKAMKAVSEELVNTPAICRKSYVHALVVSAFETGALKAMAQQPGRQSGAGREKMLGKLLEAVAK